MKKETILSALSDSRKKFLSLLEDFSPQEMEIKGVIEDWYLKDLLVHLTRWEAELVKLLWQAKAGIQPTTVHFSQDNVDIINERWFQESKSRPFNIVWNDFSGVREQTLRRVKEFSESQLNDDKLYSWLGGRPLSEWIAGDSFDHEAEHARDIRAWKDRLHKSS
jgi:hypothetical protein